MLSPTYTGPAIWANADHDQLVTVTGFAGDHEGRPFFTTAEGQGGLPGDELRPLWALQYARAGLSVIPIGKDKKPAFHLLPKDPKTGKGIWEPFKQQIADEATIVNWAVANGQNTGIVCGAVSGGLLVIDFDEERFFYDWWGRVGALANGLVFQRTGKGMHVICRTNNPGPNSKLAWVPDAAEETGRRIAIETRGEGGYIVAAPSQHPNGKFYEVIQGDLCNPPRIPQDQADELLKVAQSLDEAPKTKQEIEAEAANQQQPFNPDQSVIDEFNARTPIETVLQKHGYIKIGKGYARPGGSHNSVTIKDGKSFHHNSNDPLANDHWRSAFDVCAIYEFAGDYKKATKAAAKLLGIKKKKGRRPNAEKPDHIEIRNRWLTKNPDIGFGLGEWRKYQNGVWPAIDEISIKASIMKEAEKARDEGIRPTGALIASVTTMTQLHVAVPDRCWDADSDVLVLQNGALRISTRQLVDHAREHYATYGLPYAYDPEAKAVVFDYFLGSTLESAVAEFLQEFAGYSLTTDTSLETAVWLFGPRGSGKTTFQLALQTMLGDRAGILGLADIERSRFALGNIAGKTLLTASEQPATYITTGHILNAIISGEQVQVERKYSQAVDVWPKAKLLWAMNELPRVSDASSGLFRRVKVVEFAERPAADRDPEIRERIATEGPGILNWALDGLARLRERGRFCIPLAVQDATEDFQSSNDIPAAFVADCCERKPVGGSDLIYRIRSHDLYQAYKEWCYETGHKPQSETTIGSDWKRLGFEKKVYDGYRVWCGLRLKTPVP